MGFCDTLTLKRHSKKTNCSIGPFFFFNLPGNTSTLLSSEEIKILRAVFFSLSAMMYLNAKIILYILQNTTILYYIYTIFSMSKLTGNPESAG